MHPTPLCVDKIVPILCVRISENAASIYHGGAGDGHPVGR
jgi:hypothetical protein